LALNPNVDGYMALALVSIDSSLPVYIDLTNKLSYLSNGKGRTGYHNLRR